MFDSAEVADPVSTSNPDIETLVRDGLGVADPANNTKCYKVFRIVDAASTIAMDDDNLIIEKNGRAIPLLGQLAHSGGLKQNSSTGHLFDAATNINIANNATQTPPSGDPSTSGLSNLGTSDDAATNIANNATQTPPSGDPSTSGPSNLATSDNGIHPSRPEPPYLAQNL